MALTHRIHDYDDPRSIGFRFRVARLHPPFPSTRHQLAWAVLGQAQRGPRRPTSLDGPMVVFIAFLRGQPLSRREPEATHLEIWRWAEIRLERRTTCLGTQLRLETL